MLYLANPCTPQVVTAMRDGLIGYMDTPAQGNARPEGVAWAADNGCFGAGYPGDEAWLAWLAGQDPTGCLFAPRCPIRTPAGNGMRPPMPPRPADLRASSVRRRRIG